MLELFACSSLSLSEVDEYKDMAYHGWILFISFLGRCCRFICHVTVILQKEARELSLW